tara:strand:+ start:1032 stop:1301 length:270 start_codon:yes stop_codon:yes gene_type:complete
MRKFYLYLPPEKDQDVISERYKHLFNSIDRQLNEVRIYTQGLDFKQKEAKHPLPYGVLVDEGEKEGKKKSFESLWKLIKHEEEYIPNYD